MAFTQLTAVTAVIAALADLPNATSGLSPAQLKAKFDEAATAIKTYLNSTLLAELESTTAGDSGAENIGSAAITGLTGATPHAQLTDLLTKVLTITNTTAFTPTANYHPATKKYVDDTTASVVLGDIPDRSLTAVKIALLAITAAEIANGTITEDKLAFAIATQAELDAVSAVVSANTVKALNTNRKLRMGGMI